MSETESGDDMMNSVEKPQKIIEMKLPLTWLITSIITVLVAMGGLYAKFDNLSTSFSKLEIKNDARDERTQLILQTSIETKATMSSQTGRIDRAESDIKDLKNDIRSMQTQGNRK